MDCPKCMGNLNPVKVETHYGVPIVIDQCDTCKGLWFDPSEYYQVSEKFLNELETVNTNFIQQISAVKEIFICPKDGAFLKKCEDVAIPKELNIEYCPKCRGYWFDRGEYKDLKENVEARAESSSEYGDNISEYLKTLSNEGKYDTLEKACDVLMKPYQGNNNWNTNSDDPSSIVFKILNIILYIILRVMLKI